MNDIQFLWFILFVPQGIYHLYKTLIIIDERNQCISHSKVWSSHIDETYKSFENNMISDKNINPKNINNNLYREIEETSGHSVGMKQHGHRTMKWQHLLCRGEHEPVLHLGAQR